MEQLGQSVLVFRNDEISIEELEDLNPSAIIISPGPSHPENSGVSSFLPNAFPKLPILGICLGHQILGLKAGAVVRKAKRPMHGKTSLLSFDSEHPFFANLSPPLSVCRYHSLVIDNIPSSLQVLAKSIDDNEIMAIAHKFRPHWGLQFHPESVLTSQGIILLDNWLKFVSLQYRGGKAGRSI